MELLVSVRSGLEVAAALAGGADIIDAKEPSRGSLGSVSPEALADLLARLQGEHAVSVALGDFTVPDQVRAAVGSRHIAARPGPLYMKLGFAGVSASHRIAAMITTAVGESHRHQALPRIVAVAYADYSRAETAPPGAISRIAGECGATAVLLDTQVKDGRGLFSWMDLPALQFWVERGRNAGLLTAVAGGLQPDDLSRVAAASPDVVGVRGAACDGGRTGRVNPGRVRALRARLDRLRSSVRAPQLLAERVIPARWGGELTH